MVMRWLEPEVTEDPTFAPVILEEAKAAQRIDSNDEDDTLQIYLDAAIAHVERTLDVVLSERTMVLRAWGLESSHFAFPLGPISEITGVTYLDSSGAEQTLDPALYVAALYGTGPLFSKAIGATWPTITCRPGSVSFTVTAGYADGACPKTLKQVILLIFGDWNKNREQGAAGVISAHVMVAVDSLLFGSWKPAV